MRQSTSKERKQQIIDASRNLEDIMRRIGPYIHHPKKSEPKRLLWKSSEQDISKIDARQRV